MRYVYDEDFDNLQQICTDDKCGWRGSRFDEEFRLCPISLHALRTVDAYAQKKITQD